MYLYNELHSHNLTGLFIELSIKKYLLYLLAVLISNELNGIKNESIISFVLYIKIISNYNKLICNKILI